MANINNELSNIKNAVYGKDVRGSIHDGIDKINRETEVASGKANQAHDVMESIINDGFDNAALQENFEQKLDDKIKDLQPEWTGFKDNVTSQLAETINDKRATVKRKGLITIETDDAKIEDYTVLLPILNAKGVNATTAVPPGHVGLNGYMSWAQIHELVDSHGWSVQSHTVDETRLDGLGIGNLTHQLKNSKEMIETQGLKCEHIAYPNGGHNDFVMENAKLYYKSGGTVEYGVNEMPVKSFASKRVSLKHQSLINIKARIDEASDRGLWVVVYTHGIEFVEDGTLQQKLEEVIDYAKSKSLEFVNRDEAWGRVGNVVDIGLYGSESIRNGFVLNRQGDVAINGLRSDETIQFEIGLANPAIDKPIEEYSQGKITVNQITNTGKSGYPENQPGKLVTDNTYPWTGYVYQDYYVYNNIRVYRRLWTSEGWEKFTLITNTEVLSPSINPSFNKSSDSYVLPVTYEQVNSSGAADYPENQPGELVTNKIIQNDGYTYQDYHLIRTRRVYRRWWESSGWTTFKLLNEDSGVVEIGAWTGVKILLSDYDLANQPDTNYAAIVTPTWDAGSVWTSEYKNESFRVNWTAAPTSGKLAFKIVR